ncbi:hypothetical protein [Microbacterium sp. cf332]|uniref:hypothetical protein n=1 Tax=Microbacterium sp. cf332 TaxID=1761804 RepID=UPI0008813E41|nr:hypothetical protein [Microbacterium sp. cf332]SDQ60198.1 hypothetical protein SAMN04487847_2031 [Microbacterium sp. cf332]
MTTRAGFRLLQLSFAFVAAVLWIGVLMMAIPAGINDGPIGACIDAWDDRVVFDASIAPESVAVDGAWQIFPLGVGCRYTAPTGESVFIAPSILPTVLAVHALVFTAILGAVFVHDRWPEPRRHDDLLRA